MDTNFELQGQIKSIGIPFIRNYEKSVYKAATQNWCIVQDSRGIMYFGNNDGVLEFDGKNWNLYAIPNRSIVRSIAIDKNQTIWVGGDNEFGYLALDKQGKYYYKSIIDKFPDKFREFGGIWKIFPTKSGIYIQSMAALFFYDYDKVENIEGYNDYQFSFYVNNRLFIQKRYTGLQELRGDKLFLLNGGSVFKDKVEVWAMIPISQDSILIATQQHGLFMFDGYQVKKIFSPIDNFLINNQIFSVQKLKCGLLAFGTIQAGLIITNLKGDIIQHIDNSKGLQNNTILSLFEDMNDQLWLGLDNGIDYIEIKSPFTYLDDGSGVFGTGYTAKLFKDYLYLGTNQGLYRKLWNTIQLKESKNELFSLIENTKGQVWKLEYFDDILICGHDRGTFQVNGNDAVQISEEKGGWNYMYPIDSKDYLIGGTYTGLTLYVKSSDKTLKFVNRINGMHESSRGIESDSLGNYWMNHGLKGIFRINLTKNYDSIINLKLYNSKNGFPSSIDNYVYKLGNDVIFCAEKGVYQYNYEKDKFEKSAYFNKLFGENNKIRTPKLDSKGNIWFYKNDHPSVLIKKNKEYRLIESIFKKFDKSAVNSYENIEIVNDSNVFFGTDRGFVHFNANFKDTALIEFQTLVRSVKVTKPIDSVIFNGNYAGNNQDIEVLGDNESEFRIPYEMNAMKFSFVATFYDDIEKNLYRYMLQGFDKNWSEWQSETEKEYTNLSPGTYFFIVQSKNIVGKLGKEATFKFVILYPWYRTFWAYTIYFITLAILVYLAILFVIHKIREERILYRQKQQLKLKQKEELFAQETLLNEQKIIKLKNEKLEAEVAMKKSEMDLKNKELASIAVQITHKNEILSNLKAKIDQISHKVNEHAQKELKQLVNAIDQDLKLDEDWEQFTMHFEDVHSDFFSRLRNNYGDLTPKDLKMCAYLRMNLSSKEIAPLMNISVRGVEISRYRLRKKLGIDKDANLIEYMLNI